MTHTYIWTWQLYDLPGPEGRVGENNKKVIYESTNKFLQKYIRVLLMNNLHIYFHFQAWNFHSPFHYSFFSKIKMLAPWFCSNPMCSVVEFYTVWCSILQCRSVHFSDIILCLFLVNCLTIDN